MEGTYGMYPSASTPVAQPIQDYKEKSDRSPSTPKPVAQRIQDYLEKIGNPSTPPVKLRRGTEIIKKQVEKSPNNASIDNPRRIRRSVSLSNIDTSQFRPLTSESIPTLSLVEQVKKLGPGKKTQDDPLTTTTLESTSQESLRQKKITRDRRSRSFSTQQEFMALLSTSPPHSLVDAVKKHYPIEKFRDGSRVYCKNPLVKSDTLREAIRRQRSASNLGTSPPEVTSPKTPRKLLRRHPVLKTKDVQKNIKKFWQKHIQKLAKEISLLDLFYEKVLLGPIEDALEKTQNVYEAIKDKNSPIAKKISCFLIPFSSPPQSQEIFEKLRVLKEIHQLSNELTDRSMLKIFKTFTASKMVKLLTDWGVSGTYHWKKSKLTSTCLLPAKDIYRTQAPDGFALANIVINGKLVIAEGSAIAAPDLFEKVLTRIYEIQAPEMLLPIEKQVSLFLFFAAARTHNPVLNLLKANPINWAEVQDMLGCRLDLSLMKTFESMKEAYYTNSRTLHWEKTIEDLDCEIASTQLDAFENFKLSHLKACDSTDWKIFESFLKTKISQEHIPYLDFQLLCNKAAENYESYLQNALLKLMIPGFEILQLLSTENIAYTDQIFRAWLHPLKNGTFVAMSTDTSIKKTFHLTIAKDCIQVDIPLHFTVHPKVNEDPDCFRVIKALEYFKLHFNWTLSLSEGEADIHGLLETKLIIQSQALNKSASAPAVLTILEYFQRATEISFDQTFASKCEFKPLTIFFEKND